MQKRGLAESAQESPETDVPHKERSEHVKTICLKKKIVPHMGIIPETFSQILVDDKYQFLYCEVPKVACTNWKRIMLILTGRMNTSDPSAIPPKDAHHQKLLRGLHTYSPDEIRYRLEHYFKFMFVRDPLERLLSAYRNKFTVKYNTYFNERFGRRIIRQYRHNPSEESLRRGHDVRFDEFVKYLVDPQTTSNEPLNAHWRHYYKLCQPCRVQYDFIGKYETLHEDVRYVLQHLKVDHLVSFPAYPLRKGPSTSEMLSEAYTNVSSHDIHKLWEMYSIDFAMFQYDYPDFPSRH